MRVGFKSSAAILPETSNVRITVPSTRGRLSVAWGRASEITSIVTPPRRPNVRIVHEAEASKARRNPVPALLHSKIKQDQQRNA